MNLIGREEMGTLQCFKVNVDRTITEIKTEGALKEKLNTEECYIIVSNEYRKVYFWKGFKSNVRSKFYGIEKSADMRSQLGMDFSIVAFDEYEEDSEFIKLIGGKTKLSIKRLMEEYEREEKKKFDSEIWPAIFKD